MVAFRAAELTELATSFRLEAGARLAEGRAKEACVALRAALKLAPGDQEAQTLMGEAASRLSLRCVCTLLAQYVVRAEERTTLSLSCRDGRLMKPLPEGVRLTTRGLAQHLQDAFLGRESAAREVLCTIWMEPGAAPAAGARHALYACRSLALLGAGSTALAVKDAQAAVAFMPDSGEAFVFAVHAETLLAIGKAEAETTTTLRGDAGNTPVSVSLAAALSLAEASSLDTVYDKQLAPVIANLAPVHRELLLTDGVAALAARIREEVAAKRPPILRVQTKYGAYFEWMADRLAKFPTLSEAERDKLLITDSAMLDSMLDNPAMDAQTLLTYADKGLSYEVIKQLEATGQQG